jgi:hypothetical protein
MAKLARLEKLFAAMAAQDWNRAQTTALEIIADEESLNHVPAARRLRAALTHVDRVARALPSGGAAFRVEQALTAVASASSLERVELPPAVRAQLVGLTREWSNRERFAERGVRRRSRVLLHGPPGCGKSMTAGALAREMHLPAYVVRLDAIVGAYLGETASRVHELLNWASNHPSVLVLDEIDALARRRGHRADVAELDRVVVAFLQELEHTQPAGLLVATTNRPRDLDEALFRRFDLVVEIRRPTQRALLEFAVREAKGLGVPTTPALLRTVRRVPSYAEAARLLENVIRETLVRESDS